MKQCCVIKLFIILIFMLVFLSSAWAQCQCPPPLRLVTVTGDAEVKVVPDEIVFSIGVVTSDKELDVAKNQNAEIVKKVLALTKEYEIDAKDIQTGYLDVRPRYERQYEQRNFIGYFVSANISITLKDTSRFDNFLSSLLKAGVTTVSGIQFRTAELRKYRDQARALAIKAAQEKANALAQELGQKISRPYSINEQPSYDWDSWKMRNAAQNITANAPGGSSDADTGFALGQISIKAKVAVSFELE